MSHTSQHIGETPLGYARVYHVTLLLFGIVAGYLVIQPILYIPLTVSNRLKIKSSKAEPSYDNSAIRVEKDETYKRQQQYP